MTLTSLPLKIKSAQWYLMSECKSSAVGPLAVIVAIVNVQTKTFDCQQRGIVLNQSSRVGSVF